MHEKLEAALKVGQSIWLDDLGREMLRNGELDQKVAAGVRGVTSNPSIFEKSLKAMGVYDADVARLGLSLGDPERVFEALAIEDVRRAAKLFRGVHRGSGGLDGFVSLEVKPSLSQDRQGTVEAAQRIWAEIGMPNVMIKVPATDPGIAALEDLITAGVPVNATLIFGRAQALAVGRAFVAGLKRRAEQGASLDAVASVASVFISRIDAKLGDAAGFKNRLAVANAAVIYADFQAIFSGEVWAPLAAKGAQAQRLLWASTAAKDPSLPDTYYVDALMGAGTVSTLPGSVLAALLDHGQVADTLRGSVPASRDLVRAAANKGVDLEAIGRELLAEGLQSFETAYNNLIGGLAAKMKSLED